MRKYLLSAILVSFAQPCFAQAEVVTTHIDITYDERGLDFDEWFAKQRTSEQGQAVTKAVAGYFGVPPSVVNISTEQFWKRMLRNTGDGEEHRGGLESPDGYEICKASRQGEVSITGPSTLNVSVNRGPSFHGLGWYAVVPVPGRLGQSGNWVRAEYVVVFVRTDPSIWNKYQAKCDPPNPPPNTRYLVLECKGQDCQPPHFF